ncbi:MAG: V-type ATPase 116kDa subunit family protein, partial [Candidatus Peribacteraceae bacterium]
VPDVDHTEIGFRAAEVRFAISVLKENASKDTLAVATKLATEREILHAVTHTDIRGIIDRLHDLEENDTEAQSQMKENQKIAEVLEPWMALPYPLNAPRKTENTVRLLGVIATDKLVLLRDALTAACPRTEIEDCGATGTSTSCVAHVWNDDMHAFEEIAVARGWTNVDLSEMDGYARELHEEALMKAKECASLRRKNVEKRKQLSVELPNLIKVQRYLQWLDQKQSAREAMSATETTVTLLGWLPKKEVPHLENRIQKMSPATALLRVKPDDGEIQPVMLRNPKIIAPFESVTNLYGLPLYDEIDPTISLAPFFALYFALCLTDAGYGAVLAVIFGTYLLRSRKGMQEAKLAWLLFLGGLITVVVSIPFGGWFGLAPEQVPAFLTRTTAEGKLLFLGQVWNLNESSGITFLQNLSLVLGITHLFYGMFLAGYHNWIHGRKVQALWVNFTPHILLGAVLFFAFAPPDLKQIAQYSLIAALIILVWGKGYGARWFVRPLVGVMGVINLAISMLSNSLSYLRLLALGLVTGAIAMAVNQVAVQMGKLFPLWLGIPVIIAICLVGHLVSIALNTLGSFIHSGRLQFIEFFSQFFEGGGKAFAPFRRSL